MPDKIVVCVMCGKAIPARSHNTKYCPDCKIIARKAVSLRYRQSEKGKANIAANRKRYTESGQQAAWEKASHARHPETRKAYDAQYHKEHPEKARASAMRYYFSHHEQAKAKKRLWNAAQRGKPGAKLAYAKATGKHTYCERMRLNAYPLPCGTREACRGCEHCPQDADFGWDATQRDVYTGDWY